MGRETDHIKFTELRRRAQAFLSMPSEDFALSQKEIKKLVHELDTYQIELELQNEDLRQAQQDLLESRNRYNDLYDFAPVGYVTVSSKGKGLILEANLTAAEMMGVERKFLHERPFSAFILPADQDVYDHHRKILLETHESQTCELRMQRKGDNSIFYVYLRSVMEPMEDYGQFRSAIIDISRRKQDELLLQESESHFRLLLEKLPNIAVQGYGPDGTIYYWNKANELIYGYTEEEALGNDLVELIIPPEMRDFVREVIAKAVLTGEMPPAEELQLMRKDGTLVDVFSSHAIVRQTDHEPMLFCFDVDIRERKRAEDDLYRVKERYRTIVMDQYDLVCRFDPQGRITFVNDAYCECFSVKYNEILGTNFIPNIHPEDIKLVKEQFKFLTPQQPKKTVEHRVILPDGRIHWQQWSGRALFNKENVITEYQAVGRDITDLKETEAALRSAGVELEQRVRERTRELEKTHEQLLHAEKLSAIGCLSASIAHEFNNPLQGVMTVIKGIGQYVHLDAESEELVGLAIKECNRMKNLIASLQDFNRPSSGISAPVDIHANIDALLLISKKDLKTRQIKVVKDYIDDMPPIMGVADQLKQVFLNLINNASYACAGGGIITIKTEVAGEYVVVHIQDNGKGIDPANIDHIFEPFFSTKSQLQGTGLGLSVSHGIVKKHGGKINVKNEPGKGTTFSVYLPVKEAKND
ncbi:MAG: PAS domain S-box protein [Desulfobulbaceae bacterium]|nr:PAS domain S-box protein [Desulfobulbaceae bacterium]